MPNTCDNVNCPYGCCRTLGLSDPNKKWCYTGNSNWTCGSNGSTCVDCTLTGQTCVNAQCTGPIVTKTPTPTPTNTPTPTPIGLNAQYFDNVDFTSLKLSRVDPQVNFDWGGGSPDPSVGADTFSVRWMGQVTPRYSQTYTFYTYSDDGIRLAVNGTWIINNWTDHAPIENTGTITLVAGTKYDIVLEYYENTLGAIAKLSWSSPSQTKEIIPTSQLTAVNVTIPPRPVLCAAGYTLCPNGCKRLTTDYSNCGSCGYSCSGNQYCNDGGCRNPPHEP